MRQYDMFTKRSRTVKSVRPKEKEICRQFVDLLAWEPRLKNAAFKVIHIPNEQFCPPSYTMGLKRIGLLPGVFDYMILAPEGRVAFIEFKRSEKDELSANQQLFGLFLTRASIPWLKTHDAHQAVAFVMDFVAEL